MKSFKSFLRKIYRRVTNQIKFMRRRMKIPFRPDNPDGRVLIHLGPGDEDDRRYINVDTRPFPHIHIISSVEVPDLFPDSYADLIYACHILEHISHQDLTTVLSNWQRWLKRGGLLRLSVPDFDLILKIYAEYGDCESIIKPLMGGQWYRDNVHKTIFNEAYLTGLLKRTGFGGIERWNPDDEELYSFNDWASRKYKYQGKQYPISLNIQGRKN